MLELFNPEALKKVRHAVIKAELEVSGVPLTVLRVLGTDMKEGSFHMVGAEFIKFLSVSKLYFQLF